jgi:hypothetical protein
MALAVLRSSLARRYRLGMVASPAHGRRAAIDGRTDAAAPRLVLASRSLKRRSAAVTFATSHRLGVSSLRLRTSHRLAAAGHLVSLLARTRVRFRPGP